MSTMHNSGYNRMYKPNSMTVGLFFPLESYGGDVPSMLHQEKLAALVESLNFSALWFRDVPLRDPTFGDVGQIFDPFVYLAWIAAKTSKIALATGSLVLPLRHPIHVAKSSASIEQLSKGRLVLGVASGDRPIEFSAFNIEREERGELFRSHFHALNKMLYDNFPKIESCYGSMNGNVDVLPKADKVIPLQTTGHSQQSMDWIAKNSDGWISYPRPIAAQQRVISQWRSAVDSNASNTFKPFTQSLYIDLSKNPEEKARPIHLGFRVGRNGLNSFMHDLKSIGVNHVIINLKYGSRPAKEVIQELGEYVLPHFPAHTSN